MQTVSLKKIEKGYQKTMKHLFLFPFFLLLIIFVTSCKEEINFETETIPIEDSLGIEPFSFEGTIDSVQRNLLINVVIINSIEQLKSPFETWNLEVSKVLEQFDYEKYTLLLRFNIELKGITDIKQVLTHNKRTGHYIYYLSANVNEEIEQSENYFFYTGILVRKISNESVIETANGITTPSSKW